jgi:hypothetical protein
MALRALRVNSFHILIVGGTQDLAQIRMRPP